jgi:hypothetical protein
MSSIRNYNTKLVSLKKSHKILGCEVILEEKILSIFTIDSMNSFITDILYELNFKV